MKLKNCMEFKQREDPTIPSSLETLSCESIQCVAHARNAKRAELSAREARAERSEHETNCLYSLSLLRFAFSK